MANAPDQTPEEIEAQNLAEMTDEISLAGQKKELAKQSESFWRKPTREVDKTVKDKRTGDIGKNYRFTLGQTVGRIKENLNETWDQFAQKRKEIENSNMSPQEKIKALQALRDELKEDMTIGKNNAIGFLENMSKEDYRLTRESLAKMEVYSVFFKDMMKEEKAKPLITIFDDFIKLRELRHGKVPKLNKTHAEIIEETLLDPQMAQFGFFTLALANRGVRKEFALQFIDKNPDKAIWMIDKGNTFGCFDPSEMKLLFEHAKQKHPQIADKVDKELGNFHYYQRVYELRYNSQQQMAQRARSLRLNASGNRALEAMTFKGTGRFIGNICAVMTIVANLVANRKVILDNPSKLLKNPYILGSVGLLTYLHKTKKGERLADIAMGKEKRERIKKVKGMTLMREMLTSNEDWGSFFNKGGTDLLIRYQNETQNKAGFLGQLPNINTFLEFCKKNEVQTEDSKKPSKKLEEIVEKSGTMATVELGAFMSVFKDLSINSSRSYKTMLIEADQTLS